MATESRPGPIRRFAYGIWLTIDFTRRLVFNLVFLFLFVLLLAALAASPTVAPLQEKTALVIDLGGRLVEQYTTSPLERALAGATGDEGEREIQVRDVLRGLEAAGKDDNIERIVLLTDGFTVSGFAAMRDVAAAIREVRKAGKQVIAYGTGMDQKGYYLAAMADEVYLDPEGGILLEGLGRYRMYYREALQDKLGIDVHVFRVGTFKSAVEPFILDGSSPEAREADLFWMSDLWQRYVAEVAAARGLEVAAMQAQFTDLPARVQAAKGDLAQMALADKLVDGLKTSQEMETLLSERGAIDEENDTFRQIDLDAYLAHVDRQNMSLETKPQLAVVVAQGEIVYGDQPPGMVGGESTSAQLRDARFDENVKGVLLRVDSPGGGVFPSEQIRREVELLRAAGKPVVVSMSNVAASGGYWISMNADKIVADPSTITGSIGIFGLWMSAPRTLENMGIRTDGVGTTPLAGAFDPTRPFNPDAGSIIQSVIERGYAQFTGKVAEARDSTPEAIDVVAQGRVWSGAQAKERGLVDVLGGLREAEAELAKLVELEAGKYELRYLEKQLDPFEQMLVDMSRNARMAALVRVLGPAVGVVGQETLQTVENELGWLKPQGALPVGAVAHCFCGL